MKTKSSRNSKSGKLNKIWIAVLLTFLCSTGYACILAEETPGVSVGWFGLNGDKEDVLAACKDWVKVQNYSNRVNASPGDLNYKLFQWCTGELEERKNIFGQLIWNAKILMVWDSDLTELTRGVVHQLTEGMMDEELQEGINQGDPNCIPNCGVGEGINSLTGNVYYDTLIHNNNDLGLLSSYNSTSGKWNSDLSIALETTAATEDRPAIKTLVDEQGRKYPMYNYSDAWYCSGSGVKGYENPYTSEFEVEMADRILKFLGDGRINEIINRDSRRKVQYTYDDVNNTVTIKDQSTLKNYKGYLNAEGQPTSFEVNAGGHIKGVTLGWDEVTGNLISYSVGTLSIIFLYEDPRFPNALTGVVNQKGYKWLAYEYDDQKRVIRSFKLAEDGAITDEVTLDYSHTYASPPFVRITDEAGKVTDRYYDSYSGAARATKVVEHHDDVLVTIWANEIDYHGFIKQATNANGVITKIERDELGREISRVEAFGTAAESEVLTTIDEKCGTPSVVRKIGSLKITYEYDASCRLIHTTKSPI